jgi:hypothetical protein
VPLGLAYLVLDLRQCKFLAAQLDDQAWLDLLQRRYWLFLTDAGQPLLNPAREFLLAGQLNLGIFLGHPDRAMAGDFRCFRYSTHSPTGAR